jgi:2-keto-4-pentenoate hydratase/2-oxohepta-3-ene-1,7-dioic acid hydratase (catechol pathway)
MGIIISQRCKKVNRYDALNCIAGYCLALDLTEVRHLVSKPYDLMRNEIGY